MKRRNVLSLLASAPLLHGCLYDRYFDIEWDEEVQLHDGRVIVVHLKHTYERLHREIGRYTSAILRDSELGFDAGGTAGRVTQLLKGGWPLALDQVGGVWYLVFYWNSGWSPSLLRGQDWGTDQNGHGQRVASLQGTLFQAISICALPANVQRPNLRLLRDSVSDLAAFNGKLITLKAKQEQVPNSPAEARIERPSPRSSFACKSEPESMQGGKK